MISQINKAEPQWNVEGFYDDGVDKGSVIDGLPVLGGMDDLNRREESLALAVAIANPQVRKKIADSITNEHVHFPVLIHPQANPGGEDNYFGRGTIITSGCVLTTGIVTGEFAIINLLSTLGHDVKLGSFTIVMPGCNISGNVQIGECSLVGTGAKLLQNLTLGKNCKVGAGAVVTKSFGDGVTVVGVPAKAMEDNK